MAEPTALFVIDYVPDATTKKESGLMSPKAINESTSQYYHILQKYEFRKGFFGNLDDYIARAIFFSGIMGGLEVYQYSSFKKDEVWLKNQKDNLKKQIFVKGSKSLIGVLNPKLSVYSEEELRRIFFQYAKIDGKKHLQKTIGQLLMNFQLVPLATGLIALPVYLLSNLNQQTISYDLLLDVVGLAGMCFASTLIIGEIGKYLFENAPKPRTTTKNIAGLEVFRVKHFDLESFFEENL